MSNVIDNETGRPLADGKVTHIIDWCGRKIGLVRINKTNESFSSYFRFSFFVGFGRRCYENVYLHFLKVLPV